MSFRWKTALVAALLGSTALAGSAQAQYNNLVIVGDSLSDTGNINKYIPGGSPPAPYYNGRYSNGPIYADTLGGKLGITGSTTDTAVGGAFSGNLSQSIVIDAANDTYTVSGTNLNSAASGILPSMEGQVLSLLTSGTKFGGRDIAMLLGGANDAFAVLGVIGNASFSTYFNSTAGQASIPGIILTTATNAATNIATEVVQLHSAGMNNFVIANLPNLGLTPQFNGSVITATLGTGMAQAINAAEASALPGLSRQYGINITYINTYALINDMVSDPSKYGLTNVTNACIGLSSCSGYLFWDSVHPTTYVQQVYAQFVTSVLDGPNAVAAQGELVTAATQTGINNIQARIDSLHLAALYPNANLGADEMHLDADKKVGVFLAAGGGAGSRASASNAFGVNYTSQDVAFGLDVKLLPNVLLGMSADFGQTNGSLSGNNGTDVLNSTNLGMYGAAWGQYWFLSGGGLYAFDNFASMNRNTFVAGQVASATAGAKVTAFYLKGGPVFHLGDYTIGPVFGVQDIYTRIDASTETGTVGMNQTVGGQSIRSTLLQYGAEASTALVLGGTTIVPGLHVIFNHDTAPSSRTISTANVSQLYNPQTATSSAFSAGNVLTSIGTPGRDFVRFGGTVALKANGWLSVNASLEGTEGSGRSDFGGSLALRAAF